MDKPPHEFWNPRTADDAKVCVARLKMAQGLLIAAANADPYLIGCLHWQSAMEGVNAGVEGAREQVSKPCPKCGRPMAEETMFKGLWTCPGYSERLNASAPFMFRCEGFELTEVGAQALVDSLMCKYSIGWIENGLLTKKEP